MRYVDGSVGTRTMVAVVKKLLILKHTVFAGFALQSAQGTPVKSQIVPVVQRGTESSCHQRTDWRCTPTLQKVSITTGWRDCSTVQGKLDEAASHSGFMKIMVKCSFLIGGI